MLIEDHESFSVILADPANATIARGTAIGTILNDDTALHIGDFSEIEADSATTTFEFDVTLEKASALPVTVSYATADGTATAGNDYQAVTSTELIFAPGETTKVITINVIGETLIEDHETFSVALADSVNATIARGIGFGVILNDDTALRISDVSTLEGNSGTTPFDFTVSLESASALPVTVTFEHGRRHGSGGQRFRCAGCRIATRLCPR